MTKSDIREWDVVKLRDGRVCVVMEDPRCNKLGVFGMVDNLLCIPSSSLIYIDEYADNLMAIGCGRDIFYPTPLYGSYLKSLDIMAVMHSIFMTVSTLKNILLGQYNNTEFDWNWEREENQNGSNKN